MRGPLWGFKLGGKLLIFDLCSLSGPRPGECQGTRPPVVAQTVHTWEQLILAAPRAIPPGLQLLHGPLLLSPGLQTLHIRRVAVATHDRHPLALGDGAAAAAIQRMVPAGPVHLLPHGLLPLVEEGLVHQEAATIARAQEFEGPNPS
jgi:hypothetical protein